MISIRPLISISSNPNKQLLRVIPSTPLVSLSPSCSVAFFSSLARSKYLALFSFPLIFTFWSTETVSPWFGKFCLFLFFFFLLIITRSGFLAGIRWSDCISKYQRIFCLIFNNWFLFLQILFGSMVNFHLLVQFPVDKLSAPTLV